MDIQITLQDTNFKQVGCPLCHTNLITDSMLSFPTALKFGKTYYKYIDDKLTAFQILAYAIKGHQPSLDLSYLVQFPNRQPTWVSGFLNESSRIFNSVEDFIHYQTYSTDYVFLKWQVGRNAFKELEYAEGIGLWDKLWYWDNKPHKIVERKQLPTIGYFMVTNEGAFICASKFNNMRKLYLSKADCIQDKLDGLTIVKFDDDDEVELGIEMHITLTPQKAKIHTLHFVED